MLIRIFFKSLFCTILLTTISASTVTYGIEMPQPGNLCRKMATGFGNFGHRIGEGIATIVCKSSHVVKERAQKIANTVRNNEWAIMIGLYAGTFILLSILNDYCRFQRREALYARNRERIAPSSPWRWPSWSRSTAPAPQPAPHYEPGFDTHPANGGVHTTSSTHSDNQCCICFEDVQPDNRATIQPCGHNNFCRNCIQRHLRENWNPRCPLCRENIANRSNLDITDPVQPGFRNAIDLAEIFRLFP